MLEEYILLCTDLGGKNMKLAKSLSEVGSRGGGLSRIAAILSIFNEKDVTRVADELGINMYDMTLEEGNKVVRELGGKGIEPKSGGRVSGILAIFDTEDIEDASFGLGINIYDMTLEEEDEVVRELSRMGIKPKPEGIGGVNEVILRNLGYVHYEPGQRAAGDGGVSRSQSILSIFNKEDVEIASEELGINMYDMTLGEMHKIVRQFGKRGIKPKYAKIDGVKELILRNLGYVLKEGKK